MTVSAALAPYVLSLSAYDLDGAHRGLPSSTVSVTISEGDPLEIGWVGRPDSCERLRASVAGLHLDAAELRQRGRGVYLSLSPLGVRALLGFPASALAGHVADLADLAPGLAHLPERLASCRSWPERRALVEQALLACLTRNGDRVDHGLQATLATLAGTARVQEAAHLLGYSQRHLSTLVRAEFGVTPKEYQRLVRFEAARNRLASAARAGDLSLAAVAVAAGFADQAHLNREWRAMAGCTPTEWLRTEILPT